MARRDITNYRTVANIVADAPSNLVPQLAEMGQQIVRQSQEAKIVENLSAAQLEIGQLSNKFQTQYEGDPFNEQGLKDFRSQRADIIDKYGEGISPLFGRAWKDNALKLTSSNDVSTQAWGYKQANVNIQHSINKSIENNMNLALQDGLSLGSGKINEAEAFIKFDASYSNLMKFAAENLGVTTSEKMLGDYRADYLMNFVSGISDANPYKAKKILDNPEFTEGLPLIDRNRLEGHVEAKIAKLERAAAADQMMKQTDPAGWGQNRGLSLEQIVELQPDPETASVIGKQQAKSIVAQMQQIDSVDGITGFANQLNEQYGNFKDNAMRDLSAAKMPKAYAAMMAMAMDNPVEYRQQMQLMLDATRSGEENLNTAYKSKVFTSGWGEGTADPKALEERVIEDTSEQVAALYEEGYNFDEIGDNLRLTTNLAKSYRIKNPGASEADAVKFAASYFDSKYKFGELNGVQYRIPTADSNGAAYDPSAIEERVEGHFDGMDFYIPDREGKLKKAPEKLRKSARAFMNPAKTGLWFREPAGEILLGKNGRAAEMLFGDVVTEETPNEIKQRKINESFSRDRK